MSDKETLRSDFVLLRLQLGRFLADIKVSDEKLDSINIELDKFEFSLMEKFNER